jgi:hypothetical protein
VSRWHVKEYYDTALEALDELQMLLPELEKYASDSNAASALTNARDMIKKTEAVLPQAKGKTSLHHLRLTNWRQSVSPHSRSSFNQRASSPVRSTTRRPSCTASLMYDT